MAELSFPEGTTVLAGVNGAGKTNILEAIALLSNGRSFRASTDNILAKIPDTHYFVRGSLSGASGLNDTVEISYHARVKRVAVNGKELHARKELIGKFPAVLFLPGDTALVDGEPRLRRDFMSMCAANADASYLAAAVDYHRVLKNRNVCLRVQSADSALYDDGLASIGYGIIEKNRHFAALLADSMNAYYREMFSHDNAYRIVYEDGSGSPVSADEMKKHLSDASEREKRMKTTLIGPQRGEYRIYIGEREARHAASTGEKRLCAVIMNIARHSVIRDAVKEPPMLLIDDALLELDKERRARVLESLTGRGQIIITVTDAALVVPHIGGSVIDVASLGA